MPTDAELFPYLEARDYQNPVVEVIPGKLYMHQATSSGHFNVAIRNDKGWHWATFGSRFSKSLGPTESLQAIITACQYMLTTYYGVEIAPSPEPEAEPKRFVGVWWDDATPGMARSGVLDTQTNLIAPFYGQADHDYSKTIERLERYGTEGYGWNSAELYAPFYSQE